MTEKRKMVSIEVPENWADAVKKFIAHVDGARPRTARCTTPSRT